VLPYLITLLVHVQKVNGTYFILILVETNQAGKECKRAFQEFHYQFGFLIVTYFITVLEMLLSIIELLPSLILAPKRTNMTVT